MAAGKATPHGVGRSPAAGEPTAGAERPSCVSSPRRLFASALLIVTALAGCGTGSARPASVPVVAGQQRGAVESLPGTLPALTERPSASPPSPAPGVAPPERTEGTGPASAGGPFGTVAVATTATMPTNQAITSSSS